MVVVVVDKTEKCAEEQRDKQVVLLSWRLGQGLGGGPGGGGGRSALVLKSAKGVQRRVSRDDGLLQIYRSVKEGTQIPD